MSRDQRFVVLKDIVIPKGTVLTLGPEETKYIEQHFVSTQPFGNDHTADFVVPCETIEAHSDFL